MATSALLPKKYLIQRSAETRLRLARCFAAKLSGMAAAGSMAGKSAPALDADQPLSCDVLVTETRALQPQQRCLRVGGIGGRLDR